MCQKPDVVKMEDLVQNFQQLSSRETGDKKPEETAIGGKPMEDPLLFTAPKPTVQHKKCNHTAFIRAVASYFVYHMLRTRTRNNHIKGYLRDHWRRMCCALEKEEIRLLFDVHLKESGNVCEPMLTFEDMWTVMLEKMSTNNNFNWLQKLIATEVSCIVISTRTLEVSADLRGSPRKELL